MHAFRPHRSRGRLVLGVFGFTAAFGFLAVSVVDPYSGATASPYFENAPRTATAELTAEQQNFAVADGTFENAVSRDGYDAVLTPKPTETPIADAAAGGEVSDAAITGGDPRAVARQIVASRGWGEEQFRCLDRLWQKESNWRVNAENRSSGAYGIPQSLPGSKMASAGADWRTNPATQIRWGLGYISGRYGTPCGAWGHSQAVNWY